MSKENLDLLLIQSVKRALINWVERCENNANLQDSEVDLLIKLRHGRQNIVVEVSK